MRVLVIIGDLLASRALPQRQQVQTQLQQVLELLNEDRDELLSPYTLTLGDEFQVVLAGAGRSFRDLLQIQAALHPALMRFSLAVGTLTTEINPRQALGMDGPAFHAARDGIEVMKGGDVRLRLAGLPPATEQLANASLSFMSHVLGKWRSRRHRILAALAAGMAVPDIARAEGISEQGVYKNMSDGRLPDVLETFAAMARLLDEAIDA